jgi:four helix bundle protein
MQSYRDLMAWKKAMALVVEIYRITQAFPKSETYGLSSQMQRAAVSIPSNIAEGHGLKKTKAYLRQHSIASGSLAELETQLESSDLLSDLLPKDKGVIAQANEVGRMLSGLRNSLNMRGKNLNPKS